MMKRDDGARGRGTYGGFRTHLACRVLIEPSPSRIRGVFNGQVVADSARALVMRETRLPWAYYFPREDVRMDLLVRTELRTHCPFGCSPATRPTA